MHHFNSRTQTLTDNVGNYSYQALSFFKQLEVGKNIMSKMTDEEWQKLYENFETTWLLSAVDHVDRLRSHLGDGEYFRPPEIRTDLLNLHGLAMDVVNNGWTSQAKEMFELADGLEMQVYEMMESLEYLQQILGKLSELFPESLVDDWE